MIGFERPLFLILLVFIFLLLRKFKKRALIRSLQMLCLILAISGFYAVSFSDKTDAIFLLDQSASVPLWEKERAINFMRDATKEKKEHDRVGLISFAGDINVEQDLSENIDLSRISNIRNPYFTNIEDAVKYATSLKEKDNPVRLVILSDLQENTGNILNLLPTLQKEKVQVDVYPLKLSFYKEISIEKIQNPDMVHLGQEFPVTVRIESYGIEEAKMKVIFDGVSFDYDLKNLNGETVISLSLKAKSPGLKDIEVELLSYDDTYKENNSLSSYVYIQGKPKVLYLTGKDFSNTFANSLETQGWDIVFDNSPYNLLSNLTSYQVVVLDNVSAAALSIDKMENIRNYVVDKGGVLLVLGGDKSLSAGNYQGTPLEDILPVTLKPDQILKKTNVAIVIVLDASGSMGSYSSGEMKIELAKESAQLVVDLLEEDDYFGLVAFDHSYQWIVPLSPLTDKDKVASLISRIEPGGGTALYPPLASAGESLTKVPVKNKHIVAITDGQTEGGDFYGLVKNLVKDKITISTIGIGEDVNTYLLKDIAKWGNGRYYYTWDIRNLPQVLLSETKALLRSNIVEKRFVPIKGKDLKEEEFPPLSGYVLTSSKYPYPVIVSSPDGDPILSQGQFGLGQVIVFTSALKPYWGSDWLKWKDLGRFFSEMLRKAVPHQASELQVSIKQEGKKGIVSAIYADESGNYINFADLKFEVVDSKGNKYVGNLYQNSPGSYEGIFNIESLGRYQLIVKEKDKILAKVPWISGYSPEFLPKPFNKDLATKLVSATSGKILERPSEVFRRFAIPNVEKKDLSDILVISSLFLFLLELFMRRWKDIREVLVSILGRVKIVEDQEWYKEVEKKILEDWNSKQSPSMLETVSLEMRARIFIAHLREEEKRKGEKK
ncbi:MAG TPA: VWA domain-containing protein [Dictyoglomaceae bacterium]|nr:VWA domain-containing protein [Dictyoglomaceae bacterium]